MNLVSALREDADALARWLDSCGFSTGKLLLAAAGFTAAAWLFAELARRKKSATPAGAFLKALPTALLLIPAFTLVIAALKSLPELNVCDIRLLLTLATLGASGGALLLIDLAGRGMRRYAERDDNNFDALLVEIGVKLLKIIILLLAFGYIAQGVLQWNLRPILTGAGVAGLAFAFAAKETLSNFLGTLVILADKPFRCGDTIRLGAVLGIVESVGMRSTRIVTPDETVVIVPNSRMESADIENLSRRNVVHLAFTLTLAYGTTGERMKQAVDLLLGIVTDFHGKDTERCRPRVFFDTLGSSALNLRCVVWLKASDFRQEEGLKTELNCRIVDEFAAAGFNLAYPTMTNVLSGDPGHPLVCTFAARETPPEE